MSIPQQLGPETGPPRPLPDYARSSATVERMVSALEVRRPRGGAPTPRRRVRALLPAHPVRDVLLRSVPAAVLLGTAASAGVVAVLLLLGVEEGHAPGLGLLVVVLALGATGLLLGVLGLRFAVVALATVRARVEVSEEGLRVRGALRTRTVRWEEIDHVESRVTHPVHWLTTALRLQDGRRVVMPVFDRHVWEYGRASGPDVRGLRQELRRRTRDRGRGVAPWRP